MDADGRSVGCLIEASYTLFRDATWLPLWESFQRQERRMISTRYCKFHLTVSFNTSCFIGSYAVLYLANFPPNITPFSAAALPDHDIRLAALRPAALLITKRARTPLSDTPTSATLTFQLGSGTRSFRSSHTSATDSWDGLNWDDRA